MSELIRNDIRIQDYKNGWFGKHVRCATGRDIYNWIVDNFAQNEIIARKICQRMLEREIIHSVESRTEFEITGLFRMYMDRDDIPDNMVRRWKQPVRRALEVSVGIVKKVEELYGLCVSQDDDGIQINVETGLKSP